MNIKSSWENIVSTTAGLSCFFMTSSIVPENVCPISCSVLFSITGMRCSCYSFGFLGKLQPKALFIPCINTANICHWIIRRPLKFADTEHHVTKSVWQCQWFILKLSYAKEKFDTFILWLQVKDDLTCHPLLLREENAGKPHERFFEESQWTIKLI